MYHHILCVKLLLTLCILLSSTLATVHGISCYDCFVMDGKGSEECDEKIATNHATICGPSQNFCVKTSNKVGPRKFVVRGCSDPNLETNMGGTDVCKLISDIPAYPHKGHQGFVCICDTDGCNAGNGFLPNISIIFIVLFLRHIFA